MPCLANLFGTVKRVAMGVTLEGKERTTAAELREVGELLAFLRQPEPPRGLKDAWEMLPLAKTVMAHAAARCVKTRAGAGGGAEGRPRSTSPSCRSRPAGRASRRR